MSTTTVSRSGRARARSCTNGNDGGVYRSTNGGTVWASLPNQPHTQIYRMALDNQNPNALYIGAQDNGTCRTLTGGVDDWEEVYGGDGFQTVIHPDDSNRIWAQYQYGNLFFTGNGGATWLPATVGIATSDRKNWNAPHVQDPNDSDRRYAGTHRVYRNTGDRNWEAVSPDLTGGPSGNPGQVDGSLTTISVSPLDGNVIWAGSNDGYVSMTDDGGGTWTDVSAGLPDRWVTAVRTDPGRSRDRLCHDLGLPLERAPAPRLHDHGSRRDLVTDLRQSAGRAGQRSRRRPIGAGTLLRRHRCRCLREPGSGSTWNALGVDLPNVVSTSLLFDERSRELLVGTFGRSVFSTPIDDGLLFYDGFESGDPGNWSAIAP